MMGKIYVIGRRICGERGFGGQPVLTYSIEYPQFAVYVGGRGIRDINAFYRRQASQLVKHIREDFYMEAVRDFLLRAKEGIPFMPHGYIRSFAATHDGNGIISLYLDDSHFTGGAYAVTVRSSATWDAAKGRRKQLLELFPPGVDFRATLIERILEQIAMRTEEFPGSGAYDYPDLVERYFCEEQFYVTPDTLVLYFQEDQLGSHAIGIPVFEIPLREVGIRVRMQERSPVCRVLP